MIAPTHMITRDRQDSGQPLDPRLRAVLLLQCLSEEEIRRIARRARRVSCEADTRLIAQGDPDPDRLFLILSGSVHIQRDTRSGRTVYLGLRGPGDHFGEMALLDDGVRMADAVTATACDLLVFSRAAFRECVHMCPEIGPAVMLCLSRRLREAADLLESRHELDVTGRLAERLLEMARRKGERQPDGAIRLPQSWTHQQLAEIIGTTRESITRALDDLRSIGAVRTESRPTAIIILDAQRLARRCAR